MWSWCNLTASQRRPYCASVKSHSPVGLVSRQWDAVDWACVLCDRRIYKSPPFQPLREAGSHREPNLGYRGADRPGCCDALPKKGLHDSCRMGRRIVVVKLICSFGHCECDGHTVHKLSQGRLTADWLASRESDCSRTRSKVSSDWVPSYIKATRPVLEQFKLARYFPDSPRRCQNRDMKLVLYWGPTNIRQHRPYRSRHSHPATEIVVAMAIWRRGLVYPAEYNSHTFTD